MKASHSIRNAPTRPHALHPDTSRTTPATLWRPSWDPACRTGAVHPQALVTRPPAPRGVAERASVMVDLSQTQT
eukprot:5321028-Prymnesium_polylepis.1